MSKLQTILIIGSEGQLGQSFRSLEQKFTNYKFIFVSRDECDLSNQLSISEFFENKQFEVVINCAAYTSVDRAETESDLANQINHLAVKQLAEIAKLNESKFIHFSTDYVFNGDSKKPYLESDNVEPLNIYGKTKLRGDEAIQQVLSSNSIIVRTSWVYSEHGNNFVKTILKLGRERKELKVIYDQVGTPTYARDLAKAVMMIIQSKDFNAKKFKTNIFNFSNEGLCSWYDFAKKIIELDDITCNLSPISTEEYSSPTIRPQNCVLDKAKIKKFFGLNIPHWEDSLKECIAELKNLTVQ